MNAYHTLCLCLALMFGATLSAQSQEFEDRELQAFVEVMNAYSPHHLNMSEAVGAQASKLNMKLSRYEELFKAWRQKQLEAIVDNDQELEAFYQMQATIKRLQTDLEEKFNQLITDSTLDMDRFEEINDAYYTHNKVRERIDALMTQ